VKAKAASPSRKKVVPPSKKEFVTNCQVMDFIEDASKGKRKAYFVLERERTRDGAFMVCVAVEGDAGFYQMDWGWHCDYTRAKAQTAEMNEKLGLTAKDVIDIVTSTMEPPTYH
jgi:hypothetical protein